MIPTARNLLRQTHGRMTAELARVPGGFGLGAVPRRLAPTETTNLVCGFCATGCSLRAHLRDGAAVNLSPDPDYPVNLGMACPKGWEALAPLRAPDRATTPWVRLPDGHRRMVSWQEAAHHFTHRFRDILQQHGPESIAFLSTGQICTEEMALLGAFFKFGMGGLHGDSNTRQCMATAHVAYKESFGFDAPPYTYADFEASDVLVFIGANPCIAHPILWQRVLRNPHRPAIIVLDPRRTETAAAASQHLALRPKSDLVLLYGIAHLLAHNGWIDDAFIQQHTRDFDAFRDFVRRFTPDVVASETGIGIGDLMRAATAIGRGRAVSFWWTMGVNQGHQAVRTAQAVINLALMTGNIGRPGTGANSITGQCNAMGSRLFGNTTSLLGGRDFANPSHRSDVARILDIPNPSIPSTPSLAYDQIIDAAAAGRIKALWIVATNTAHSWIDSRRFQLAVRNLDLLVVQDLYDTTDTARLAHLFLPAAGWGEKDGTFINSERRIGRVRPILPPPGQALPDFDIFRLLARSWGCGDWLERWKSPAAAFDMLRALSAGRPCDFSGIRDFSDLDQGGGIQWPWPAPSSPAPTPESTALPPRERRLFSDGAFFTQDQRARFHFEPPCPPPETPDDAFPCTLLTGRGTSAQWHTNTRTGKSEILRQLYPAKPYAEINPGDALTLGLRTGDPLQLTSRRGTFAATALVTAAVQPGHVFVPMHYAGINDLTFPAYDPLSRQPSYKHCAVRVQPLTPPPSPTTR